MLDLFRVQLLRAEVDIHSMDLPSIPPGADRDIPNHDCIFTQARPRLAQRINRVNVKLVRLDLNRAHCSIGKHQQEESDKLNLAAR